MKLSNASRGRFACFREFRRAGVALACALMLAALASAPPAARAATQTDIQQKISDTNVQIAQLEKDIARYENDLADIGTKKQTLQNEVNRLDISRKKLGADIAVTEAKITQANLKLSELSGAISDKESRIATDAASIAASLRAQLAAGERTLVEQIFSANSFADAWEEYSKLAALNLALRGDIGDLSATKTSLTTDYNATNRAKSDLVSLKNDLAGQKAVLDGNRAEESALLAETKNKESEYQKLLAQKKQAKADFEKQLSDYEASLSYTLDPNAIPKAGSGVLSFPLDPVFMARCPGEKSFFGNIYCVTQYFGDTAFARTGAYNGKGHNGVDFGAPEGTKVVSARPGVVAGVGNTDLQRGCYSYGKWVLVAHDDGLATIYAHLSVIGVSKGDPVSTGQLLGYSGSTGYATGPHLHFGLYVASQVKILRLGDVKAVTHCGSVFMPVAPTEAYLDPMSYL